MGFSENLKKIRACVGITQRELANEIGISANSISNYENGVSFPDEAILRKIYTILRCEPNDLFDMQENIVHSCASATDSRRFSQGQKTVPLYERYATDDNGIMETFSRLSSMSKDLIHIMINHAAKMEELKREPRKYEEKGRKFLPCAYTPVSAGIGTHMPHSEYTEMLDVPENDITRHATYAFYVNGDSMEPDFHNNDIVAVKYAQKIDLGDIGIFDVDDTRYIKKYTEKGLESLNPEYETIQLDDSKNVCCLGAVLGKIENVHNIIREVFS